MDDEGQRAAATIESLSIGHDTCEQVGAPSLIDLYQSADYGQPRKLIFLNSFYFSHVEKSFFLLLNFFLFHFRKYTIF